MSTWIVDGGKIRPTYPECPFKAYDGSGSRCGGDVKPFQGMPWPCGILIQLTDGTEDSCDKDVKLVCDQCGQPACEECMNGNWKGR